VRYIGNVGQRQMRGRDTAQEYTGPVLADAMDTAHPNILKQIFLKPVLFPLSADRTKYEMINRWTFW
jgi:hypothetical protein